MKGEEWVEVVGKFTSSGPDFTSGPDLLVYNHIMRRVFELARGNRNIFLFLLIGFLRSLWFVEAIWYFYWGHFASYSTIGIAFAIVTVLNLIAEIPSGYFADKYGRKLSVIVGVTLIFLGVVAMALTPNAVWLFIGAGLANIGQAFISGALEALVYDSMLEKGQGKDYEAVMSFKTQLSLFAYLVAVPIGGYLYSLNFRAANLTEMFFTFPIVLLALIFKDSAAHTIDHTIPRINEIKIGFKELFSKILLPYVPMLILLETTFLLYDWGLSKPAMAVSFGFNSSGQSIIYPLIAVISIFSINLMPKIRRFFGDYWGLRLLTLILGFAFVFSTLRVGVWGLIIMVVIDAVGNISSPWTTTVINNAISSKYRATTISTLSFLTKLPHVFVNVLVGYAIAGKGIGSFHLFLGIILIFFTMITTQIRKRLVE